MVTLTDLQLLLNTHNTANLEKTNPNKHVYPNPFSEMIIVDGPEHILHVLIMAQLGRMIGFLHPETNNWLSLSFLTDGLYFLSIFNASGAVVRKIFKQS